MTCPACQAENDPSASQCVRCGAPVAAPTEVVVTVDLKPGALFDSRYEILAPLGRGGMGMVYKARDRSLDEVVAIKVLRPDFAEDPRMAERFRSEIRLARKVRHRNVCTIHDYGEDRGLLYISMELIEGVDLKRILQEQGALPPEEAYEVAVQIAEGLQAVHDAGIIHRDLKTPNIMRDAQGVARLMDFGIAKRRGDATLTATGNIVGTPEYMSPELAQGQKADFRSDVYGLGVVAYEIFTGRVPFKGETPISTILKHINEPPPLDGPQAARLPATLKPVLRKALAKDPAERYATAHEFAEALREARSPSRRQVPVPTEVLEAPTLPRPRAARPRTLQAWLLVLPAFAVAGAVLSIRSHGLAPTAPAASPPLMVVAAPTTPPAIPAATSVPLAVASTEPAPVIPVSPAPMAAPTAAATSAPSSPRAAATSRPSSPRAMPAPSTPRVSSRPTLPLVALPASPSASAALPATPTPAQPPAEGTGHLFVVVRPWAGVSVDGKELGETPLDKIPLSAGTHTLRLRHPAYEPIERTVTIRPGQTERVVVDLPTQGARKP